MCKIPPPVSELWLSSVNRFTIWFQVAALHILFGISFGQHHILGSSWLRRTFGGALPVRLEDEVFPGFSSHGDISCYEEEMAALICMSVEAPEINLAFLLGVFFFFSLVLSILIPRISIYLSIHRYCHLLLLPWLFFPFYVFAET